MLEHGPCRKPPSENPTSQCPSLLFSHILRRHQHSCTPIVPERFCDPVLGFSGHCDTLPLALPEDRHHSPTRDVPGGNCHPTSLCIFKSFPEPLSIIRVVGYSIPMLASIFRTYLYGFCITVVNPTIIYLGTVCVSLFVDRFCFPLRFFVTRQL